MYSEATQQFEGLPPDFSCIFVQDDDAYFKNTETAALDDKLGDLDAYIKVCCRLCFYTFRHDITLTLLNCYTNYQGYRKYDCQ
jgi:hypothetical protein